MRRVAGLLVVLLLGAAGCGAGGGREPGPSPSVPVDSTQAFQTFSGLTLPATASAVEVRATLDSAGEPSYKVQFRLPSDQLDQFAADGQLDRPLRVTTIPASYRAAFDYTGDSSTGAAVTRGGLPDDQRVLRQVLATGTKTATADVRVFAARLPG